VHVEAVKLYHRVRGAINYSEVNMALTHGGTWEAILPASSITTAGVEYYIRAVDPRGNGGTYPAGGAQTPVVVTGVKDRDVTAPVIDIRPPSAGKVGEDLVITLAATDTEGIAQVILYYRGKGSSEWRQSAMDLENGTYRASIPKSQLKAGTLEYYIVAEDVNTKHYGTEASPKSMDIEGEEAGLVLWAIVACVVIAMVVLLVVMRGRRRS
jgi:hypothetical protein